MAQSDDPRHGGVDFAAPRTVGQQRFKAFCRRAVERYFDALIKLEAIDHDKIPTEGPVIIAPSHRSNIDTPIIGAAMQRDSRFMAKETIFKSPFWTKFLVALGGFPVRRGTLDRASLSYALAILERGEMLVVYPEGARQEGPRIKPVFEGAVWLAARAGAPIVPAGIGGSHEVMGIGVKIPRRHKVFVVFGDPIHVRDPADRDAPSKRRVPRARLEEVAGELREALQRVYDDAQVRAGTPNRLWSPDEPGIDDRIEPWH